MKTATKKTKTVSKKTLLPAAKSRKQTAFKKQAANAGVLRKNAVRVVDTEEALFNELTALIEDGRQRIARAVNATLSFVYWKMGERIRIHILAKQRAAYGKKIIARLGAKLTRKYGKGWDEKTLRHCLRSAETMTEEQIVSAVRRQLSWTHLKAIIYLKDELQRSFYLEMCIMENWSTRQLQERIDSMLYERTAISKKPEQLIRRELKQLKEKEVLSPDLVFRDPYVLSFLGLHDTLSEKRLEEAIVRELELFLLELGQGFTFVERQKRMLIDGEDFRLDLLFYHRKLKRLVAIDIKVGKFKAAYKSQMELYLRWLEKHENETGEKPPIGLLLCAQGNKEQIELLQLHKSGIKVAEYLTELPDRRLLQEKMKQVIANTKKRKSRKP